jgi:manganese transport protein
MQVIKENKVVSATKNWWLSLGPAIITAALVFGPGSLTITSKLGAVYGYSLLWVVVLSTSLMIAFTQMGARIGIATNQSLLKTIREKWGKGISIFIGIGFFMITTSFQAGNSIGAGVAFAESFNTSAIPWIIFVTLSGISLLFFKSFYKILEKVMIAMVGLMLISFLFTLLLARPDLLNVAIGLIPSIPDGSLILVVALTASSFSVGGAFYQAYLVQAKGWKKPDKPKVIRESFSGIFLLGFISAMILVSSGAILRPLGVDVTMATDMGKALEPLYGQFATSIFMLGLFGASFSSLIGNATIGGSLFADAMSLGSDLNSKKVKFMIMLIMVIGAVVAIVFGRSPLELIVFAQGMTIFVVPFIGIALFSIANDKALMGTLVNRRASKIWGIIGLFVLFALAIGNFNRIFLS